MNSYFQAFKISALRHAARPCFVEEGEALTYSEVDLITDRIAGELGSTVVRKAVAICLKGKVEFYLAQLAVLKAGGFFVPIDLDYPAERIGHMLSDSEAALVIVDGETDLEAASIGSYVLDLRRLRDGEKNETTHMVVSGEDTAYMIYTSGSTGLPKGVPIHHSALLNHNRWFLDSFSLTPKDRVLQFTSVSFDISIEEIFPTFLAGAALFAAPAVAKESLADFLDWIERNHITVLNFPTAYWHEFTYELERSRLPESVRLVVIGGEKVSVDRVDAWFASAPSSTVLFNSYGPTETTIVSSGVRLEAGKPITIGKPIRGMEHTVVDDSLCPVSKGEPGELLISGVGVSKGYWRRPDLTSDKFVQYEGRESYRTGDRVRELPSGEFEFLGRIDDQIKINGYRIEPGEIQDALLLLEGVTEAVVVVPESAPVLVAYFVSEEELDIPMMQQQLRGRLPSYLVPDHFVRLERMPMTSGGKIDRRALPGLPEKQVRTNTDTTVTERELIRIWNSIFYRSDISVDSDFFALGGDSLKAIRFVKSVEEAMGGCRISIASLAGNPTISALGRHIDAVVAKRPDLESQPVITTLNSDSRLDPIVAFHGAGGGGLYFKEFEECLTNRRPFQIVESGLLYSSGAVELPEGRLEEIAAIYADALAPRLGSTGRPVHFTGYSLGGLLAYEVARLLSERGVRVGRVVNIDAANPGSVIQNGTLRKLWKLVGYFSSPGKAIRKLVYFLTNQYRQIMIRWTSSGLEGSLRAVAMENLYNKLEDEFQPKASEIPMILIASREDELSFTCPEDYGWTGLVPAEKLTRKTVPGDHLTMMTPTHLPELLEAFRSSLED